MMVLTEKQLVYKYLYGCSRNKYSRSSHICDIPSSLYTSNITTNHGLIDDFCTPILIRLNSITKNKESYSGIVCGDFNKNGTISRYYCSYIKNTLNRYHLTARSFSSISSNSSIDKQDTSHIVKR
jgi:hypothetical protein